MNQLRKLFELELSALRYDTGYGECDADLIAYVEVDIPYKDSSFDHAFGVMKLTELDWDKAEVHILANTLFCIDQDGGVFKEMVDVDGFDDAIKAKAIQIMQKES